MTIKVRAMTAATVAAAACASLTLMAVPSASAATDCGYTPNTVILKTAPADVVFAVPGATTFKINIPDWTIVDAGPTDGFEFDPADFVNADAGSAAATVASFDASNVETDCTGTFKVLRFSSLTLGVTAKGGVRTLSGTLSRVNFGSGTYGAIKGATVTLQRQTASGWVNAGTATTATNGTYSTSIKIGPRTWRAVYAGISTTAGRTSKTRAA